MEFSRALAVAVKIFLVDFFLSLVGIVFYLTIFSRNLPIAVAFIFVLGLFGSAVTVYFILEEAEKISRKTESYVDTRRYDNQIGYLRRMIDEIIKALPKEASAKMENIQGQCPQCGKKVPKGFRLCAHCGFDWRHIS